MDIHFLGHACFELTEGGTRVLIDPFLTGNQLAPVGAADVEPTHILLTHGHGDHWGDIVDIAKRTGAQCVAIVEQTSVGELYDRPAHPYTKALLASALEPDPTAGGRPIVTIPGEVPDPASPPPGCRFAPRCPWRAGACAEDPPAVATGPGRWSRCHFADDLADVSWPVAVTPETLDTKGP